MRSSKTGNGVANQYVIETDNGETIFQSYATTILLWNRKNDAIEIDEYAFHYSRTTSKYLRLFLDGLGIERSEQDRLKRALDKNHNYATSGYIFIPVEEIEV